MHKHMPIQIFSSAAIGFGYNTAREIAEHIKNNTTLSYFPLANTGPITDVIAQEQAAAEFGLTPIYARTIFVGDGGDYHLVILAKDDEARSWLNQQPERYTSAHYSSERGQLCL